jgi:sigma-B regulation protein RsbU (phosphoserine phosphatase)
MDLSLCTINLEEGIIQYAGANNPIYIIRNNEKVEIVKADRMPIGIHINHLRPFAMQEVKVKKGDMMYLFTDGYADQFGGPAGQKFRYNQFQELILKASSFPIKQQEKLFESTLRKWQGKIEQLDDILILGIAF